MATVNATVRTLLDWAKQLDPQGNSADIVEMMSQTNDVVGDALFKEGNLPTGDRATIRTGLPAVYWRLMNQGVLPSKSRTAQVDENAAMLEAWSEVDVALANLGGNAAKFRMSEARAFIEAMGQEFAQTFFYGSASSPEEFVGLANRYSSLSATNGSNIISGSGAGSDNSSIYLVGWGENAVHGIFPKGSKAGIQHHDHGEQTVDNAGGVTGAKMRAYQDQFVMNAGLVVKDWRYCVRIPNIDISNLVAKSSAADLIELMIKATKRIPSLSSCKPVFYMNRTCEEMLDIQMRDDVLSGGQLKYEESDGKPVLKFRGIPVRRCDALLETEAVVS
jgi:hypothetical protein